MKPGSPISIKTGSRLRIVCYTGKSRTALQDGLKPVQRRILHAMKEMDDGDSIK
jgi:hypothetical protein